MVAVYHFYTVQQITDPIDIPIESKEEHQNRLETKMNNRRDLSLHFQAAFR